MTCFGSSNALVVRVKYYLIATVQFKFMEDFKDRVRQILDIKIGRNIFYPSTRNLCGT